MGTHLKTCLSYISANKKKKQNVLSLEATKVDGLGSVTNFTYDEKKAREFCSHMILYHEYPFNIVEHRFFNKFANTLSSYWVKISYISATYEIEKRKLKTMLTRVHEVNITTDMWTSRQQISYMVVTCHFIDSDWHLNRRVFNFCNVSPPHTGFLIANALQKYFQEWGIENKICSIIVDNARSNDVAFRVLKYVFNMRKAILASEKLFHVRCVTHITNLLVQDGLGEISLIVDCVRNGIKYLVALEERLVKFSEIAKQLQLTSKKLFLDVAIRWNSTYMMLAAVLEFKGVFSMYSYIDSGFIWLPSDGDCDKI